MTNIHKTNAFDRLMKSRASTGDKESEDVDNPNEINSEEESASIS